MCSPTIILSAASTGLRIMSDRQEAKAEQRRAQLQGEIAENARIQKENQENLRLRQIAIRKKDKVYDLSVEAKEKRGTALAAAESVGGKALDRVINNYFRLEGKFSSQILANLEAEINQSNENKKLFALEQEARTPYIPEVDTTGIFAANAIEFGGDYLEWKTRQEEKKFRQQQMDELIKRV